MHLEFRIFKIPLPDITAVLDIDATTSMKLQKIRNRIEWKGKTKDIHEEDIEHLKVARIVYQEIAQDYPNI